jgi:hypothetical protein
LDLMVIYSFNGLNFSFELFRFITNLVIHQMVWFAPK